ncbi:MAG: glycosyltransferase [Roseovarius sp.]|nr:glycosyltransferase [Roseovarius sp.]
MGISELRQLGTQALKYAGETSTLGDELVKTGTISKSDALLAQLVKGRCDTSIERIFSAEGLASERQLLDAHANRLNTLTLSADDLKASQLLADGIDPRDMIKHGFAPLSDARGRPVVVTAHPDQFREYASDLPLHIAGAPRVLAGRQDIQNRIVDDFRTDLSFYAETRVQEAESCRHWGDRAHRRVAAILTCLLVLAVVILAFPTVIFSIFAIWAAFTLVVTAGMKTAAFVSAITAEPDAPPAPESLQHKPLPKVSILVPLFRETEVLHALVARLSTLTYPKCLLDVILVLEEEDKLTQATLAEIDLPPWIRAVICPDGQPRTKPRAMNYALDFCEGDIVGIFDAEDAPDPDQITKVARRFQHAPDDVACLQGILDYYNPSQNWLARCFTIEYATWFRVMLPGMARLGFAIPLGGTTLYFKRNVLEALGGWDAHNVTEDADLGFRLARHGYRTEMVHTITEEEANCRFWPWIKQRSRWLKGYMTTYLVHMRNPVQLFHQLGAWKFLGFQAHFLTALSQFILAPVLWSFWLVLFGLPHPLDPLVSRSALAVIGSLFLLIEVLNIAIHTTAVSGAKHRFLMLWSPTMHFYSPLGAIAAYKALYELVFKPFYWDKTTHGLSLAVVGAKPSDSAVDFP